MIRAGIADINSNNLEHLFLLAYRSTIKEFHSTLQASSGVLSVYDKRFELEEYDEEKNWFETAQVTRTLYDAYEVYLYWETLNDILQSQQFDNLQHTIIELQVPTPTLAVSTIFPLQIMRVRVEMAPSLILNVFPQGHVHLLIFSYLPEHSELAHTVIRPIMGASGHYQLYLLSKLILKRCDNFVLQPDIFEAFSDKKKEDILRYFKGNYLNYEDEFESDHLMLFTV